MLGAELLEGGERPAGVQALVRPARDHVGGDVDGGKVRALGGPIAVVERMVGHHRGQVLDLGPRVLQAMLLQEGREVGGDPAVEGELAVDVAEPFTGVDRGERGRAQRRGPPLGDGEPGDAAHADLAGAPRLRAGPGDHVGAVTRLTLVPHRREVAPRPPAAARIDVDDGVAE